MFLTIFLVTFNIDYTLLNHDALYNSWHILGTNQKYEV